MSFSPGLLAFIRHNFSSVWALELLLLMRGSPDRAWTRSGLVAELRASELLVSRILDTLGRGGLISGDDELGYRYAPAGPTLSDLCDQLQAAYRDRPVAVIKVISAPTEGLQALANAFRIKGDDR